jgi:KDO2-lipid IV(A) lauroyltransferase
MKRDSVLDYLSYILFKVCGPVIRLLPIRVALFLGARAGDLFYLFDARHKAIAYANLKTAFEGKLAPCGLNRLTRDFYRTFGQNLTEMFFLPRINREYIGKYITIENQHHIEEGFKRGKGVIFLGVHEGSWEISSLLCVNLGFSFSLLIRNQRLPRLNRLLNSYRSQKGCRIIRRQEGIRDLISELKQNHAIGMTLDQGGRSGMLVDFFGKDASMPTGAIRLALKYGAAVIPVFYTRKKGPYVNLALGEPLNIESTGNSEEDIRRNLQKAVRAFEKYIRSAPWEYLWSYKIWKYSRQRKILILSDGKAGHLRQAQALAGIFGSLLKEKDITLAVDTVEVRFRHCFSRNLLLLSSYFSAKFICQGCLWCLRSFLEKSSYAGLMSRKPDIIISCGSSLASVNLVLARENLARSVMVMRPSLLSNRSFDLVVAPSHDRPPKSKNTLITEGALNLITRDYLASCAKSILGEVKLSKELVLGFLLGGDARGFHLNKNILKEVIGELKSVLERLDGEILVSTSRRTTAEIEDMVKKEFSGYERCRLLVIANERNHPAAVGGILALSKIVVTSPESISMVSEAASSGSYTLVFNAAGLDRKHQLFLDNLSKNKYIYRAGAASLGSVIEDIWRKRPQLHILQDNIKIKEGLARLL